MNYAIVDAGGKQVWVEQGKFYDFNYINSKPGDTLVLNRVLFLSHNGVIKMGNPCIINKCIKIKILKHFNGKKLIIFKMKPKKNMRIKQGHRQKLTRVLIQQIL